MAENEIGGSALHDDRWTIRRQHDGAICGGCVRDRSWTAPCHALVVAARVINAQAPLRVEVIAIPEDHDRTGRQFAARNIALVDQGFAEEAARQRPSLAKIS